MVTKTQRQFIEEVMAALPEPGNDPVGHLRHTLAAFDLMKDDDMAIMATSGVYGDQVRTGLTYGDLRAILAMITD